MQTININAAIKWLQDNENLTVPENVRFRDFVTMQKTAAAVGWLPPSEQRIVDIWNLIKDDLELTQAKEQRIIQIKEQARELLFVTDWKIIRHNDQMELSGLTSITQAEYQALLIERQNIRDLSNQYETAINNCNNINELNELVTDYGRV